MGGKGRDTKEEEESMVAGGSGNSATGTTGEGAFTEGEGAKGTRDMVMCVCVCVNLTSGAPSIPPPADYHVPGAVLSKHLGAAVNKIKDATLTSTGAQGRPLALLHLT
jgi:hypothetical protein